MYVCMCVCVHVYMYVCITTGRVPPWSVLYLLYIKHDQKVLKFDKSIGRGGGQSVIPCLVNTAIFIHQRVVGQDNSEGIHVAVLRYNK